MYLPLRHPAFLDDIQSVFKYPYYFQVWLCEVQLCLQPAVTILRNAPAPESVHPLFGRHVCPYPRQPQPLAAKQDALAVRHAAPLQFLAQGLYNLQKSQPHHQLQQSRHHRGIKGGIPLVVELFAHQKVALPKYR